MGQKNSLSFWRGYAFAASLLCLLLAYDKFRVTQTAIAALPAVNRALPAEDSARCGERAQIAAPAAGPERSAVTTPQEESAAFPERNFFPGVDPIAAVSCIRWREKSIEGSVVSELARMRKLIGITPEQEAKLKTALTEQYRLGYMDLGTEVYEELIKKVPTVEAILSRSLADKLQKYTDRQSEEFSFRQAETELAYITEALALTTEQENQLRSALNEPNRNNLQDKAFMRRLLELNEEQSQRWESVQKLNDTGQLVEEFNTLQPELIDSDAWSEAYSNFEIETILREAGAFLTPEQLSKLREFYESAPTF